MASQGSGRLSDKIVYSGFNGGQWCANGRKPTDSGDGASSGGAGAPQPGSDGPPDKPADAPREKAGDRKGKIRAIPFEDFDEASLPRRAFLLGMHYQRGQCTCSVGQDGAGKSSVGLAEAIVVATGRPILGEQPPERCRVWIHNADDDSHETRLRIAAFCRLHNVPRSELVGWLFVSGKDNFTLRVASGNGHLIVDHASVAAIVETIVENEIDLAIFDPLVTLHGVAENDNVRMSEVIHIFGDIAAKCSCAIDVCHHTRKPSNAGDSGEREFNSDDARGASAVRAAVRASRVFNRMSKAEASSAGVSEEDRLFFIRIDRGKANYLPPATKSTWYRLASVQLLNDQQVGAIEPWTFPGADAPPSAAKTEAERAADHVFLTLLERLTREGRTVSDRRASNYAPVIFAKEREAKIANVGKAALEDAMRRLFEARRIRTDDSGTGGKKQHRLVVV